MDRPELLLQEEVVAACRRSLAAGAARRRAVDTPEKWRKWREEMLAVVRAPFPPEVFERPREVGARVVSAHDCGGYRIENVLFEALPGWEVNGSVYLPEKAGRHPGVVCPTGHSDKTGKDYQQPAQVFARNGYVAISFDPPDCSGELAGLNDHFANGMVGYLTGLWSQTHFVLDALRCMDYLETRADVDATRGFAVTGVSGGGMTSIFAAMLDERVQFVAPVCCLGEHEHLHMTSLYTSCPEQFGPGYIAAGLDYADYVALAGAPKGCLVVGGELDELFAPESMTRVFEEVRRLYAAAGAPDRCGLFIQQGVGHSYTVAMASEVVRWMNRYMKGSEEPAVPLGDEDVPVLEREKLLCQPRNSADMFTLNRDRAARLARERAGKSVDREEVARLLGVTAEVAPVRVELRSEPRPSWHVLVEEVDLQPADGAHVFGVMFSHVEEKAPRPGLLWIDERGKWAAFRQGGFLAQALDMTDRDCPPDRPRILSVDVAGMGVMAPEPTAYDLAGWNNIERILSYMAIADGRPVMGLRVRDALCALAWLRARPDVDGGRLMIGGRGIGAIVALHAALLASDARRVVCAEMLGAYGMLAEQFPYAWPETIFVPGILERYDLPEMAAWLGGAVTIINPADARREALSEEAAGAKATTGADVGEAVLAAVTAAW